jgi:long-chain acyl-CoA synthetase
MATMIWALRRAVQMAPDGRAVVCGGIEYSYAQTWERCCRLVGGLRDRGVGMGDRVAVVGANCHRYLEVYQAVAGAGMAVVPLNQRHTPAELRYALEDSGAKVLFTDRYAEELAECVEHVVEFENGYEEFLAGASLGTFPDEVTEATIAGLFYTGGTTGAAKGVILTHGNLVANALHFQACWPFSQQTCWLIQAPLFHAAGSIGVLATVWNGGQHVVLGDFDPGAALDLIESQQVTATLVVPTMLAALSDEQLVRPRDVTTLGWISHGGAPIATGTLKRAHTAFPSASLLHIYGATETSPIATLLTAEERLLESPKAGSCGQPAVGVEVAVLEPEGEPAPPGTVGEVVVRGANVMLGYWNKPVETAAALVGGWYHTGDLGYLDDEMFLYLVDRAKDMIVTGGENVYSTEVEEILYGHPSVLEAAVFGIPDARWGEAVHAVVVPRVQVTAEELIQHCRAVLAGYKVPKTVELRSDPLPKSGAGKVLKRELRAPYWLELETKVAGA